ncbi:GNAT family N-acetyltransferase, partial [Lactococcus lactis]
MFMVNINLVLAEHQTLQTERLILRKLQLEDAPEMFNYASNPEVARFTSFEPHDSLETTRATIAKFFQQSPNDRGCSAEKTWQLW